MDLRLAGRSGWLMLAAGLLIGLGVGTAYFYGFAPDGVAQPAETQPEATPGTGVVPDLPAPIEGAKAPDFDLTDLEGSEQRLSDLRGSVVLLNFWATWCPPCEAEMPMLDAAYQRLRDQGFVVLAVNFDEPERTVRDFRDRLALTFPVLLDPGGTVQQLYRVRGYPTSFIVDRRGVVQTVHIGIMSEANLSAYLESAGLVEP